MLWSAAGCFEKQTNFLSFFSSSVAQSSLLFTFFHQNHTKKKIPSLYRISSACTRNTPMIPTLLCQPYSLEYDSTTLPHPLPTSPSTNRLDDSLRSVISTGMPVSLISQEKSFENSNLKISFLNFCRFTNFREKEVIWLERKNNPIVSEKSRNFFS